MSDQEYDSPLPPAPSGGLQGRVQRSRFEPEDGFWHQVGSGVGKVVRGIGQVAKKALPYLAEADFSSSSSGSISGDWDASDNVPIYEPLSSRRSVPMHRRSMNSVFSQDPPRGHQLMGIRLQPKNDLPPALKMNQIQANSRRILDAMASAKGLPSYEQFHQQHGVPYQSPSQNSGLGVQTYRKAQSARQSTDFIREANSEPASKAQASRRASQPSDEPRFQSADEILSEVLSVLPARRLPKAEYQNRDEDRKQDLWPKLQAGQALNDNEMKQLFLTLDIQHYQAQTEKEKLEAELLRHYAEQKLAENLVSQASRDADDNVLISGVPVRVSDALYFAKQDIQHFRETDTHLRPDQLEALRTMSGRYKRTGKLQELQPRVPVATRLREARTTGGSFKPILRMAIQMEKMLAQKYPNNPSLWKGRFANNAAQVRIPIIKHNSNDIPLTKAGHALDKHGRRKLPNSVFPEAKGTNRERNHLGQEIVEDILFDEATIVKKRFLSPMLKKRYPNIKYFLEVKADYGNGPGIRYSDQYEFITFLEP
jgi:hypothetical protein